MKKFLALLLVFCMALSLIACAQPQETATPAAAPAVEEEKPAAETKEEVAPAEEEKKIDYPTKQIDMIVPYAAGGSCDIIARTFAAELEQKLGTPIVVTNMAGATGSIGGEYVLEAEPDGYTVLFCAESPGVWQTMGVSENNFSAFTPISLVCNDPKVIVTSTKSEHKTMDDLAAAIQSNPGKIKMAHSGAGSSGHIQGLMFAAAGYEIAMTPYGGSNDALLAVMGGQVDYTNANLSTVLSYVESGDLAILASFSAEPIAVLENVPAVTEAIPALEDYVNIPLTPQSFLVPKDTPVEIVDVLRTATQEVFASEEWESYVAEKKLEKVYASFPTPEDAEGFYSKWTSIVSWLLYDAGASVNEPSQYDIARWS